MSIEVEVTGGLGNQLFQYAFGRAAACQLEVPLVLNTSAYLLASDSRLDPREFKLDQFNIKVHKVTDKGTTNRLLRKCGETVNRLLGRLVQERTPDFDPALLDEISDGATIKGYWQTEKYFMPIRDILLDELTLKKCPSTAVYEDLVRQIKTTTSVSLHVRRSDKSRLKQWVTCTAHYYKTAFNLIKQEHPDARFYVFTDDPEWCRETLGSISPIVFVSDLVAYDCLEIQLMRLCKHHITGCSSFSWWGAWLSENPRKIVITPNEWYNPSEVSKELAESKDLIPEDWIRISNFA